jgi:hypothetical protein
VAPHHPLTQTWLLAWHLPPGPLSPRSFKTPNSMTQIHSGLFPLNEGTKGYFSHSDVLSLNKPYLQIQWLSKSDRSRATIISMHLMCATVNAHSLFTFSYLTRWGLRQIDDCRYIAPSHQSTTQILLQSSSIGAHLFW